MANHIKLIHIESTMSSISEDISIALHNDIVTALKQLNLCLQNFTWGVDMHHIDAGLPTMTHTTYAKLSSAIKQQSGHTLSRIYKEDGPERGKILGHILTIDLGFW